MINRLIAPLIVVITLGFVLLWDSPPGELISATTNEGQSAPPHSITTGGSLKSFGENGELTHSVTANELIQYKPKKGPETLHLKQPKVTISDPDGPSWSIHSEQGFINTYIETVQLNGEVVASQPDNNRQPRFSTEELTIDMRRSYATTDKPVIISALGHRIESEGISAYLKQEKIELHSKVKGIHERP